MKEKTKQLLEQVQERHDWQDGQPWGGNGTQLSRCDTCRVCGLARTWFDDRQNGITDQVTFQTYDGDTIPLIQAAAIECC